MHIVPVVVALWALGCQALPASQGGLRQRSVSDGGYTLPVERRKLPYMKSGPSIMAQTREKYKKHIMDMPHEKITVHPAASTVEADPTLYDQEYLAPVMIGGQLLQLDIDTGSSDLWVYSTYLSDAEQGNHSVFNPNKSSTAQHIPESSWSVAYGDGSEASGNVWTDCVWIGQTVVENQGVELAESLSPSFMKDPSDGILGLGFDSLNSAIPMQMTYISNAIAQGLPEPVFTADLYPGAPGSYDIGFINASKYSGKMSWAPVDASQGYWLVNMTGWSFGLGPNQTQSHPSYVQLSVVDTGTSVNFFNVNVVRGYWATVAGAKWDWTQDGYVYPCGTPLPDFTVQISDFNATIPGRLIAYAPTTDPTICFGGIQSQDGLELNILGDVFLKSVFVAFNMSQTPQIGFAAKARSSHYQSL